MPPTTAEAGLVHTSETSARNLPQTLETIPQQQSTSEPVAEPTSPDAMLKRKNDIEAMLSVGKNENSEKGLTIAQAQEVADAFMKKYNGNIPLEIRVVNKQEDAYGQRYSQENIGYVINGTY